MSPLDELESIEADLAEKCKRCNGTGRAWSRHAYQTKNSGQQYRNQSRKCGHCNATGLARNTPKYLFRVKK